MILLPRWKVLSCGIVLLLGVVVLVYPFLRLGSARQYLVASPWSPKGWKSAKGQDELPLRPPPPPPPPSPEKSPLKYKPAPTYTAPPVKDPFPLLSTTSTPPPIPAYNVPPKDAWKAYDGVTVAPPLLIGFTRNWPMLLQTVVSYLTAGWPADQLYVVENTGTQQANARAQLSLQNPRFLNHTQLRKVLGVRVVQTPVLLSFAQLQNFFLALSYDHGWPYYFWSHMDVVALSHEAGVPGLTAAAGEKGYKSLYTLCLETLQQTLRGSSRNATNGASTATPDKVNSPPPEPAPSPRWAARFFAYDHLTLQNPRALEAIGGWDAFIPYYMTDCDAYSRFAMAGWSVADADAGIITDTASVFDDLRALYRDPGVVPRFSDPNPPAPEEKKSSKAGRRRGRRGWGGGGDSDADTASLSISATATAQAHTRGPAAPPPSPPHHRQRDVPFPHEPMNLSLATDYWWVLRREADNMFHHKHGGGRGRNTWQGAQRGGGTSPLGTTRAGSRRPSGC
ncbi:hypothetical protein PG993_008456 [Apiospora rasikravindrae]|uniref:Uncharacterized protein n=1 Tax=Apiospora rasikravindrae TaxID=990691 RepID=A0ABR1T0E3_9PEZI